MPKTEPTLRELIEIARRDPQSLTPSQLRLLRQEKRRAEAVVSGHTDEARHRDYVATRKRKKLSAARDIGELPPVADLIRRESCRHDLAKFLMTYAPEAKDPFSEDHIRVIKRIENAIFHGGRFIEAVYRGFGKSTIAEIACVWAIVYGHKKFIPLICANSAKATENMESIRGFLESSDLLAADFPEVCVPIRALDGIAQRAGAQTYLGEMTHLEWSGDQIVFPWIPLGANEDGIPVMSDAAGSVILCTGITSSRIRGMKRRRTDGVQLRPDFAIIDDPQDEESANSPGQINKRLNIIRKAILRSAGHKESLSVVMPCTVIQKDDLVDQLLDPVKFPAWQGERIPFFRKFADRHEEDWLGEYASLRNTYDPEDPDDQLRARARATEFYRQNRERMDAGCIASWSHCYAPDEGELSAIQHGYNALIDDGEDVFFSEFQNEPVAPPEEEGQLTVDEMLTRISGIERGVVPMGCERVTAFVDVQGKILYWVVCAWSMDFTGYVLDYGTYPDQRRRYFTLRQASATLQRKFPGAGQEGCWRQGFEALGQDLLQRDWKREDGTRIRISRMLLDANDGNASNTVYEFCRHSDYAAIAMPSRGKGVTASATPFNEYKKKAGDRVSPFHWRIPSLGRGSKLARFILSDVNWWKSFMRSRLRTTVGDAGALTIFAGKPERHRMFAEHCCSEYSTRTEGRGRVVDEWKVRPGKTENHWWDCLVGCAIAASEQGVAIAETGTGSRRPATRKKISLAEKQRKKLARG